jgi:hypothetical protein
MAEQKSPFGTSGAGANAFKSAYDRLKAEADARKQGIAQDYSSAYQQLRGQTYTQGLGAAAQKGLSGGQAAGVRGAVSAQQMGQLGNLMQGQERALREAKVGEGAIYSNALLEGQQAQEMENARLAQINALLTTPDGKPKKIEDLTPIERQQLEALGYNIPTPQLNQRGNYANVEAANVNKPPEKEGSTLRLVQLPFGRGVYWVYRNSQTGVETRA